MHFKRIIFILFLTIFSTFITSTEALSATKKVIKNNSISIQAIKDGKDLRILFSGKGNDFTYSYSKNILSIKFKNKVFVSNLNTLSNLTNYFSNAEYLNNTITITLVEGDYIITKFKLRDKFGIDIKAAESKSNSPEPSEEVAKSELPNPPNNMESLIVDVSANDNTSSMSFIWTKYVSAASYIRGSKVWIVFNNKLPISTIKDTTDNKWFKNLKQEPSEGGTIFSADLINIENTPNLIMYRDGFNWYLDFSDNTIKPKDIRVVSRPLAAPQPRVEIELEEIAQEPIRFKDEYVGDNIVVIPVGDAGTNLSMKYSFVDFELPKTIQGAVILPKADALKIRNDGFLIKIEGSGGLNIAPRVFKKREQKFDNAGNSFKIDAFIDDQISILSIKTFQVTPDKFLDTISEIKHVLSNAKTPFKRAKIMANWALFYLANGLYTEGLAVIKLIKKEDIEFSNTYNIKLIESVLQFMNSNYFEAYETIRKISIIDVPLTLRREIRFWQAISGFMVSGSDDFLTRMDPSSIFAERSGNFLSEYDDKFMFEILMSIISNKINEKKFSEAASMLKLLDSTSVSGHDRNRVHSIAAHYYAKMEKHEEAIKSWDKCLEDVEDLKNRTKCRFDKANYLDLTQRISYEEYIKEVGDISYIWHGDQFEIDVLSTLGNKYYDNGDYTNALRSWDKITKYYPYSPDSLRLSRKMSDTFINYFLDKNHKNVSHLEALALFYEFENLVPIGDLGDDIITKFTDHLIALDLLDRASALLNHQVKNRLNGSKKEEVINKLANVYLLNDEPVYAVDIINEGESYTVLPDKIASERKYIHALALSKNGEVNEALKLLKSDYSQKADDIKSDIYWNIRDWKNFNDFIEPRIYKLRDEEGVLDEPQSESVLKLAISYLITEEWDLLNNLYKDFKPRMPENNRNTAIFLTLENSWDAIKQKNLQPEQSILLMKQTVDKLVESIK